jgi:putative membrane protein
MIPAAAFYRLALGTFLVLLATGFWADDHGTWLMEIAPALIAVPLLAATRRRFPLTPLLYGLIALHMAILATGGVYTYARVPLGVWIERALDLSRNPYDKIGHFVQGFVPSLIAREILVRRGYALGPKMLGFLCLCVAMAISAWYELIEWGAAIGLGQGADAFLGAQGDPWDTQSDMLFAFIGATVALTLLARCHNRFLARLSRPD